MFCLISYAYIFVFAEFRLILIIPSDVFDVEPSPEATISRGAAADALVVIL